MEKLFYHLVDFSLILLAINVLLGFKSKKLRPELKWFEIYLIFGFIVQVWMRYLAASGTNNLFLTHAYAAGEFILLSLFFREIFSKDTLFNRYFVPFVLLIIAAIIGNILLFEPLTIFNSNSKTLTQVIIITYTIVWFFRRLNYEIKEDYLLLSRMNAAMLVYYAGSLLIFMSMRYFDEIINISTLYLLMFNVLLYIVFLFLVLWARWRVIYPEKTILKSPDVN